MYSGGDKRANVFCCSTVIGECEQTSSRFGDFFLSPASLRLPRFPEVLGNLRLRLLSPLQFPSILRERSFSQRLLRRNHDAHHYLTELSFEWEFGLVLPTFSVF